MLNLIISAYIGLLWKLYKICSHCRDFASRNHCRAVIFRNRLRPEMEPDEDAF